MTTKSKDIQNQNKGSESTLISTDLLVLKFRNLIADKERVNIQSQHDLQRYGEYQCDYESWYREICEEIEKLLGNHKGKECLNMNFEDTEKPVDEPTPKKENVGSEALSTPLPDLSDELHSIAELTNHCIPFYAYGDNEAACEMSHRLQEIYMRVNQLGSDLTSSI